MSEEGSSYTFNGHRESLYRLLEASVRSEPGCPDAACDNRPTDGEVEQTSVYPSPFLWYDEIRPSDIDAYHAANGRSRSGHDNNAGLEDPLAIPAPTSISTPTPTPRENVGLEPTDPDGECSSPQAHAVVKGSGAGDGGTAFRRGGRRPAGEEALRERRAIVPGSAGSTSSTPDGCKLAAAPLQPPPSPTKHPSPWPHGKASGVPEGEDGAAAVASTGSSNAHDRCCSKPLERNDYNVAMTPQAATSTTPPDPSQATQTMFLPGLPSQVLVTQQQGDAGWEHPEGNGWSPGEEDAAASENSSPSPTHARPFAEGRVVAEASAASRCSSVSRPLVHGGEEQEEASSRQNDAFTHALKEFVGDTDPPAQSAFPNGSGGGGSGVERMRPPFKYVPTLEVLPHSWSGGQAGVVAFLEKHLAHARSLFPGGYAVRALQLACHVLRQPTVCVRVRGNRGGGAAAGEAATVDDEQQNEVVGVAGFVWELLRANGGDDESVAASLK